MKYQYLDQPKPFLSLCDRLRDVAWLAFDTEFVSEHSYVPQLCLIQIATPNEIAVVDACKLPDVSPFWQVVVEGEHETIVHAGREELQFCHRAMKVLPKRWFDVQLAAGFLATDYPSSYSRLVERWLQCDAPKGETRTDWRRRPLTESQLDYAVGDVAFLSALRDRLAAELASRGRRAWFDQEMAKVLERSRPQPSRDWEKLHGVKNMADRPRSIVRALWEWRNEQAEQRNCSPRRVLRDDLVVEIARRGHTDPKRIVAIRGVPTSLASAADEIGRRIQQALQNPPPTVTRPSDGGGSAEIDLITQFLAVFLGLRCRQESIATMIVARNQEIRELVVSRSNGTEGLPELLQGWRAPLVGNDMLRLLRGEAALRIRKPNSTSPIVVEPVQNNV